MGRGKVLLNFNVESSFIDEGKVTLTRKEMAAIGRAIIRGNVSVAVRLQGNRVIDLFVKRVRSADVSEFAAEIYQFLLVANQLSKLLLQHSTPMKKVLKDSDLENVTHLRNIWEHRHPLQTRLTPLWKVTDHKQTKWLNNNFSTNWNQVYSISVGESEVLIGGILSVNKLIDEAEYWIETARDFEGSSVVWFPADKLNTAD